jgi:hypothetical protein
MLCKYPNIFAQNDLDFGHTNLVQHNIDTGPSKPHKEPPRRVPYHLQDEVNDTIDKCLSGTAFLDLTNVLPTSPFSVIINSSVCSMIPI